MEQARQPLTIRRCSAAEAPYIRDIINTAAQKYCGVIPDDCWKEPYFSEAYLAAELDAGVEFWGAETSEALTGVMGIQRSGDVHLIRHAYVHPAAQGSGVGTTLLKHLLERTPGPILIGTWAAATWAIDFYKRHGFRLVAPDKVPALLETFWTISPRQIETSVVLTNAAEVPQSA